MVEEKLTMGSIKKVLNQRKLRGRDLHNSRLFVDLSENVHIHFRELRLVFGVEEFFEFVEIATQSAKDVRRYLKQHPEYTEGKIFDGLLIAGGKKRQTIPLRASPKPHQSKYFNDRLQIELQDESVIDPIHIHFRDYRLVMSLETFGDLALGMRRAETNLSSYLKKHPYFAKPHPFRKVVKSALWQKAKISWLDKVRYWLVQTFGGAEHN